jgi:Uma2 family endonuclease
MSAQNILTASEFAARKLELPEAGRWHELHDGQTVLLSAPDDAHGTVLLNLSKALAHWFRTQPSASRGYACHQMGVQVQSHPDTVYVPAVSIFQGGQAFSQFDQIIATEVPRIVIDIASSNDRRRDMRLRTTAYMKLGVQVIWIPDPFKKEIQVIQRGAHTLALGGWQYLEGGDYLPGFRVGVESVFAQPKWWNGELPEFSVVRDENGQTRS